MKCEAVIFDWAGTTVDYGSFAPVQAFMEALKVKKVKNVIKVGDTVSDIKEAKNAGVIAVGIIEGSSEMGLTKEEYENLGEIHKEARIKAVTERYKEAGADFVIMDIRGILDIIQN